MDSRLRKGCFIIAVVAGAIAIISIGAPSLRPVLYPATIFTAATAALLFVRILLSRVYRNGIDAANREMQGDQPWPGRTIKFSDREWGLFGRRAGTPALLWVRAILVVGILPLMLINHWIGIEVVWLWFAAAFVAMELSLMYVALYPNDGGDWP